MSGPELTLLRHEGRVAIVTLNRPAARNALNLAITRELSAKIAHLATGSPPLALVLTGAGDKAFCAGADLVERGGMSSAEKTMTTRAVFDLCQAVADFPTPTIAAIRGYCLAGGVELAVACDLRVAAADAVFGMSEVRIGVFPGAGATVRLPRLIGPSAARDLLFTGRRIDASDALRFGLIDRLVDPGGELDASIAIASEIAANAPLAVRSLKQALRESDGLPEAEAHAVIRRYREPLDASADYAEGLAAFAERRAPRFEGR